MEIYDMEASYLYSDGWKYRVGKIKKVNDKSITMEFGIRITKEDFKNIHRLTSDEIEIFEKQLIGKLSNTIRTIKNMTNSINALKQALQSSELVCINSDSLQNKLDLLNQRLSEELPKTFKINGKTLIFDDNLDTLIRTEK